MVAIFNKELVSWYLITLKLRETVETTLPKSPDGTLLFQFLDYPRVQDQNNDQAQTSNYIEDRDEVDDGSQEKPMPQDSEWIISIKEKLDHAHREDLVGSWAKLCIYRVPHHLKDEEGKALVPQLVSLGPYHHSRTELRQMDCHKWCALYHMLKRTNHDIKIYPDSIKELEEKARSCYEGNISLTSNEFVEMMVLDGCFVLELFRGVAEGFKQLGYPRNDPIFAVRGSLHSIHRDMIMLENQIPIFILDRLLSLQLNNPEISGIVAALALRFFDPLMPTDGALTHNDKNKMESSLGQKSTFDPLADQGGLHCLDIFRRSLLRAGAKPVPRNWIKRWTSGHRVADKRRQQLIHCVSELREAGIKFKLRKTDRFWDIKFKNGVLRMPRLLIHDGFRAVPYRLQQ